ncbi:small-conductance mechanosensitive channel [Aliiruegeria haliotis]|uniref:Small-conductance mechanosensitive channel n=1 Tax=Aliiruegeria haliotis TaxID=1280846 RepID=A0A2T0RUM2_9RHOB|nr:DUF3772 domain-containing protein [Aliiruegeria haliotis]PRY24850.1 small-conductance mechanosensitive channel [Aliiruegeria haliotis]
MHWLLSRLLVLALALSVLGSLPAGPGTAPLHLGPAAAHAQDAQAPLTEEDFEAWERTARRAERALDDAKASNQAFEELRTELVDWRSLFQAEQGRNSDRIETLEAQIASLGTPAEGQAESVDLSDRRAELNAQYQTLRKPVLLAIEAHARASGLISQVDHLLRERQQQRMLERGPSPVNPTHVVKALEDARMIVRILIGEVSSSLNLRSDRVLFLDNLPSIAILVALAGLLLVRGRGWFQKLVDWLVANRPGSERLFVVAMIISVGQVLLPMIGIAFLVAALQLTSMFGSSGEEILLTLPFMGAAFFGARWLGGQTFPKMDNWPRTLDLPPRERVRGRFYFNSLGVMVALAILISNLTDLFALGTATGAVFAFPVIVMTALCLAGIARLLIASGGEQHAFETQDDRDEVDERGFLQSMIYIVGRICLVLAFLGPIAAVLGYTRAAVSLTLAPGLSIALLALVTFLQRLSMGLFQMFAPAGRTGTGLAAVLVNFAIMIASLPFFALIWGARWADLTEIWATVREGFKVGDTSISPSVFMIFVIVFLGGYLLTRIIQGAMRSSVLPRTSLDPGARNAVDSGLGYVGIFASAMVAISVAGLDLSNLAIVAGALSVGIGFGLQNIVQNFVSGLILLIERPVTEGDWIEVGSVMGTVRKISVRATTVETFDRTNVVVPNSDLVTGQVTNWTRGSLTGRLILTVGVAYGTDTRKVAEILQEVAEEHPLVIVNPPPTVVFQGFGADSLDFEIRVILRDINFGLGARTELNHRIAERLAEAGIEIPFAQRDIWLRNPEALGGGSVPVPAAEIASTAPIEPDANPEIPSEDDE